MTRLLLTVVVVAVLLLVLAAMRWGWQRRAARQAPLLAGIDLAPPADLGDVVLPPAAGLYVGSTVATSWQDRVAAGGLGRRAAGTVALYTTGALLDRAGDTPVFVPAARLRSARVEPALAGKVMGRGGLLVLRWQADDDALIDSGFRADDRGVHLTWLDAVHQRGATP